VSRHAEAEAVYGHPLQYAYVEGLEYPTGHLVLETGQLDDEAVLYQLRMRGDPLHKLEMHAIYKLEHLHAYRAVIRIERYNRCPTCEQWSPCDVRRRRQQAETPAP
jgi:hypothetical protein